MDLNSELDRLRKYAPVEAELQRAKKMHPNWPDDRFRQLAIMQEEAGEVAKAVIDHQYKKGSTQDIESELIQTAAMCMRMLESLNHQCKHHDTCCFINDEPNAVCVSTKGCFES